MSWLVFLKKRIKVWPTIGELNTKFEVLLFDLSYANALIREHIMDVIEWHIETSAFILADNHIEGSSIERYSQVA